MKKVKMLKGLMGLHRIDQYMHYRGTRRRGREVKRQKAYSKKVMLNTCLICRKKQIPRSMKPLSAKEDEPKKTHIETYCN